MNDLGKRVVTGVIGIAILLAVILEGGDALAIAIFVLSIIGLREFYRAMKSGGYNTVDAIGYAATFGFLMVNLFPKIQLTFILNLTMLSVLMSYLFNDKIGIPDMGVTLLGVLYIPLSLNHVYLLDGTNYIWLIFLIAFGSDTFAYFAGNLFGKTKLSPTISPNKTVEGSVGGIIGSVILASLFGYFMNIGPIWKLALMGAIGAVFAQMGDLIASKIKRTVGIKDYGFIMPGHGGVLDRFDSIILSTPLIYYFIEYLL